MSKRIEIISIGDELLLGSTVNTNVAFIGQKLCDWGYDVARQTTISDDHKVIVEELKEALNRSDIIITTGGLGPTVDDITRSAIAEVTNCSITPNQCVLDQLSQRFGTSLPNVEEQANIPSKAEPLLNTIGTAPGLYFNLEGKELFILPGVPVEMKELFEKYVLKIIPPNSEGKKHVTLGLHSLREADVDPIMRKLQKKYPPLQWGIYPHLGLLSMRISFAPKDQEMAKEALDQIKKAFPNKSFEAQSLAEELKNRCNSLSKTVALAESCTGGTIASTLTEVPGASSYFLGSLVTYSNTLKQQLLKVPKELIDQHGAVSEQVAKAMVEGLLDQVDADIGAAVTGIAGPDGGSDDKPVGTIWCALMKRGEEPSTWQLKLKGNREANIKRTTHLMIGSILENLA